MISEPELLCNQRQAGKAESSYADEQNAGKEKKRRLNVRFRQTRSNYIAI